MSDRPHPSGEDRLAVYTVTIGGRFTSFGQEKNDVRRRVAETSLDGLGLCLLTLQGEGEFEHRRVGVFDRETRAWLISPWAGMSPWIPGRG